MYVSAWRFRLTRASHLSSPPRRGPLGAAHAIPPIHCMYIHTHMHTRRIHTLFRHNPIPTPARASPCVRAWTYMHRTPCICRSYMGAVCMYVCMCSWFLPSFLAGVRRCVLCGHVCGHMYVCCMYGWMEVGCPLVCRYVCT
jgi:hypothetical protein